MRVIGVLGVVASAFAFQAHADPVPSANEPTVIATVVDRGDISARFLRPPLPTPASGNTATDAPVDVVVGRLPQVPPAPPAPPAVRAEPETERVVEVRTVVRDRPVYYYPYPKRAHKPHKPHRPTYSRTSRSWSWANGNRYRTERRWRDMARR